MVYRRIFFRTDKCRRTTVKKHGEGSYTVNLAGRAMYEVGDKGTAKALARTIRVTEANKCGKPVSKKEQKFADNY